MEELRSFSTSCAVGRLGDLQQAVAHPLAGGLELPVDEGALAVAALAHLVLAELLGQQLRPRVPL